MVRLRTKATEFSFSLAYMQVASALSAQYIW